LIYLNPECKNKQGEVCQVNLLDIDMPLVHICQKKYENSFDEAPLARVVSDTSHGSSQGICEKKGFEK
jgi:hypothetical protein